MPQDWNRDAPRLEQGCPKIGTGTLCKREGRMTNRITITATNFGDIEDEMTPAEIERIGRDQVWPEVIRRLRFSDPGTRQRMAAFAGDSWVRLVDIKDHEDGTSSLTFEKSFRHRQFDSIRRSCALMHADLTVRVELTH
jgi:hypothetical protein